MPQISVTVTKDELAEMHLKAGAATLSNYVRERLGLPALQRGRGSAARGNAETVDERAGPAGLAVEDTPTVMRGLGTDVKVRGTNTGISSVVGAEFGQDMQRRARALHDDRGSLDDFPLPSEQPARELSYESDDKPATIEGDFEPKGRGGQK